jgi:hypothetical protein
VLSKEEHIDYWKRTDQDSWDTALYLQQGKRNVEAFFMYCLSIEKLLKANWVLDNAGNYPPRIYDLQNLHSQTDVELASDQIDLLDTINRWNIECIFR